VAPGAVQVPAGGLPIVLLVEHPSTGGYPKIANVISADLSALAQLRPGEEVRFAKVSFDEARRLLLSREGRLDAPGVFLP
jgi:antagonist of KipI